MNRVKWSRRTMLLNSLLFYFSDCARRIRSVGEVDGNVLGVRSRLAGHNRPGRYFVCRRCKYYGVDCPSFAFSHLARMFKKDESRGFSGLACHIDILVQVLVMLLPVLAWILSVLPTSLSAVRYH